MKEVVVFNVVSELSTCKYFGKETIKNCIASVCHKLGVVLTDVEHESVVVDVEHAFEILVGSVG